MKLSVFQLLKLTTFCVVANVGSMAKQLDKRPNNMHELQISAVLLNNNCPDIMEYRSNCSNGEITANIVMPSKQNLDVRFLLAQKQYNFSSLKFIFLSHLEKLESS